MGTGRPFLGKRGNNPLIKFPKNISIHTRK